MGIAKYKQCNDGIAAGESRLSVRQSYMTTITLTRKIGTEIHQNVQMSNFVLRVVRDLKICNNLEDKFGRYTTSCKPFKKLIL